MSNYRRRNYSPLEPEPPTPAPVAAPVIDASKCAELDNAIFVSWTYTGKDAESIDGYRVQVRLLLTDALIREVFVTEPDTDVIIDKLANDTVVRVTVIAVNPGGDGPPSKYIDLEPNPPKIVAPTLTKLVGGDGQAVAEWSWSEPVAAGHRYEWMSFEAVNEVGATITEHVTGGTYPATTGTLPLTNDHDWKVALVAVASSTTTGKNYPSGMSNAITVHTEQPLPPYRPRLTGAQIVASNNGQIEATFVPGIQDVSGGRRRWWHRFRKGVNGPKDITAWQLRWVKDGEGTVYTADIDDGNARSYTTSKVGLGTWYVDVRAKNAVGFSQWSNQLAVTYKPTDDRPFTSTPPFASYSSGTYNYAIFDPGNDPSKGWDTTWTVNVSAAGRSLPYDVLVLGAGGGGKGTTATLGKGGNGGGGAVVYEQIGGISVASFTVFASIGGATAIDPKDSYVNVGGKVITGTSGKSSSSGTDATGAPRARVSTTWLDCFPVFGWLSGQSDYVGGVALSTDQNYPNGTGFGQGGAGTKTANPGKGTEGVVIIRWPRA